MPALAVSNEEEDGRLFADFALELRDERPRTAALFDDVAAEGEAHRRQLLDLFSMRFGPHVPLVRRGDVRGSPAREPAWQTRPRGIEAGGARRR